MYLRNLFRQVFDFIVRIFQMVELNLAFLFMDVFFLIEKGNCFYQHLALKGLTFTAFINKTCHMLQKVWYHTLNVKTFRLSLFRMNER